MNKTKDDITNLTKLGSKKTECQYNEPDPTLLETFPNLFPGRNYIVKYIFNEFTSLCPKTRQPDFATIEVRYIPDQSCIETKSLKLYFLSYRQYGTFMETLTNMILNDCVKVCNPKWMKIISNFNPRGGTIINVEAEYESS